MRSCDAIISDSSHDTDVVDSIILLFLGDGKGAEAAAGEEAKAHLFVAARKRAAEGARSILWSFFLSWPRSATYYGNANADLLCEVNEASPSSRSPSLSSSI